jgi:hypothetical protein
MMISVNGASFDVMREIAAGRFEGAGSRLTECEAFSVRVE